MTITYRIKADLRVQGVPQRIKIMQNDSARQLEITLNENNAPWEIPNGVSAYLAFTRPDGRNIKCVSLEDGSPVVTCSVNTAIVTIPPAMTAMAGSVPAVIVFLDANGKQIATFPIVVQIIKNPAAESQGAEIVTPDQLTQILSAIAALNATVVQQKPLFANSIEECTDTTKLYVLPDGYIYAYTLGGGYTNLVPTATDADGSVFNGAGYQDEHCLSHASGGATLAQQSGHTVTGFIPLENIDIIRMSGVTWGTTNKNVIAFYDKNKNPIGCYTGNGYVIYVPSEYTGTGKNAQCLKDKSLQSVTEENGVFRFNIAFAETDATNSTQDTYSGQHVKYMRISAQGNGTDMVVTINEEIAGRSEAGYGWRSTGHAFVPADYEGRIVALENEMKEARQEIQDLNGSISSNTDFKYAVSNVLCIGDSLTNGAYYAGAANGLDIANGSAIVQNYPYYLGRMLNCNAKKAATNGYSASDWYNKYINSYVYSDYDTFIVWLGTNYGCTAMPTDDEISSFVPSGSVSAATANQALYLIKIIQTIQAANPSCHIVLGTVFGSKSDKETNNNVVAQIAEKYGCQLVDMSDLSYSNHPELHAGVNDPHFGKAGNIYIANRFVNEISRYIAENPLRGEFGISAEPITTALT